ncbi:alpha/beta hydrolase [Tsukamurella sp. 8F]|uniref:alpha/beta fold hydrolase n=1 Tax=unclassified Tsukamurella TaxID=2633480 RepID=UPI0023B98FC7|nr:MULTISPECIES: alpha/beta hydrolase [unclassified Tsukamurella]MDF0529775.1 alpha/beta hydrolase [Tsukamurella sp. 8J]MDF0586967.1 alpha/beta hydrolase [Tsukamurella sp. 8F]
MTHSAGLPHFDYRPGEGPTLVFLHYWGGSAHTWAAVIDELPGRAVLALDFRGWGRSSDLPGPYTLDRHAADVLAVLEVADVRDYILIGHSMGGKVAQLVAARHPNGLRRLVLAAPAPARPGREITTRYQTQLSHAYDSDDAVAEALDHVLTARELDVETRSRIVSDSRATRDPAAAQAWPLSGITEDITHAVQQIAVPAAIVVGTSDVVEPPETLRDNLIPYLATSRLVLLPGVGHLVPLEAPADLAAVIGE